MFRPIVINCSEKKIANMAQRERETKEALAIVRGKSISKLVREQAFDRSQRIGG